MSRKTYLEQIKSHIGPDQYSYLERRAVSAYDAFTKMAMHHRGKDEHHDPHKPRSRTVDGLIIALYEASQDGDSDIVIHLSPLNK